VCAQAYEAIDKEKALAARDTYLQRVGFPAAAPPRRKTVESLETLANWRRACVAMALMMVALLALSGQLHLVSRVGIASALVIAGLLAAWSHVAREIRLRALMVHQEFAQLPGVARKHRAIVSVRRRRSLAHQLRESVSSRQPPSRFDGCAIPVLWNRATAMRAEVLDIASALEGGIDHDPVCVAIIRELLSDGTSPLYNPNVPEAVLRATLGRASGGLKC
jgi:hypothetical protein